MVAAVRCSMKVSIHAPVWGATWNPKLQGVETKFQSTPPCGGRRLFVVGIFAMQGFQSTPPCGGRRGAGETSSPHGQFQSTPPCGGRPHPATNRASAKSFNPRPRVGGDTQLLQAFGDVLVSIHAPVWGATRPMPVLTWDGLRFQSTPPCGGRQRCGGSMCCRMGFQSTPPCGGRLEQGTGDGGA